MQKLIHRVIPLAAVALVWTLIAGLSSTIADHTDSNRAIPPAPVAQATGVNPTPIEEVSEDRIIPTSVGEPHRIGTCVLPHSVSDFGSSTLTALVSSRATGRELWAVTPQQPVAPASVIKLLTAVAAWNTLGPDHRLETQVVAGLPGEVWLVGGGDATLTRSPANNYYDANASLGELADATVSALVARGLPPITTLHLDDSRYAAFSPWDETWRTNSWALGYVAPITAIQVDGDRNSPAVRLSPRSQDPTARAGQWFVDALTAAGNSSPIALGERGIAPEGEVIASVQSAPVRELIGVMLEDSDNTLAEMLIREVAIAKGLDGLEQALIEGSGLDQDVLADAVIRDGSGLSPLNQLSSHQIVQIIETIAADLDMAEMLEQLPVSGETGSLRQRFVAVGSEAAGAVRAKTGSISGVRSLAGIIRADDGSELVFSLNVSGRSVTDQTRNRIDALVASLYSCGENLAHWSEADSESIRE